MLGGGGGGGLLLGLRLARGRVPLARRDGDKVNLPQLRDRVDQVAGFRIWVWGKGGRIKKKRTRKRVRGEFQRVARQIQRLGALNGKETGQIVSLANE